MGTWTREAALVFLTPGKIQYLLSTSRWQLVFRGVYADGGYVLSPEQRAFAALLATGGAEAVPVGEPRPDGTRRMRIVAAACGRTAARVWGFPLIDDADPATGGTERFVHDVHTWRALANITLPPTAGDPRGHELHRHRLTLLPGELGRHSSGLWMTSPLRTALDCVQLLGYEAGVCVLDDGLHRGLFTEADLRTAIEARKGWPQVRELNAAVTAADGRAEAPSETLARLILLPVLPGLVPQVELYDRFGNVVARFDLGDDEVKLAVDMDGKRGHAGTAMVAKDRRRDRRTEPYGWWTERGTWFEVRRQQREFQARVVGRAAMLRRRAA
jgi:hypothetical protein